MRVSYAMCERVVERDGRITHFAVRGWWRVLIDGHHYEGQTRSSAIHDAATCLQRRLTADLKGSTP